MTMKYANILVPVALLLALSACAGHVGGGAGGTIGPTGPVVSGPNGPSMGNRPPHVRAAPRNGSAGPRQAAMPPACDPGYQFDSQRGVCFEQHEPRLVQVAKCRPGETRRVPDPSHPGGVRIRVCGYVNRGGPMTAASSY